MSALARQSAAASVSAPVPTPCIGVCELDAESGFCRGCARNADEIALWQQADDAGKAAVWEALPERRAMFPLNTYRLPWPASDIAAMIERSLYRRWGRWVLGSNGASVAFEIAPEDGAEIISNHTEITAVTSRGALRLLKHEKTIAIAFGDKGDGCGPEAIGLILPRGRVALRKSDCVTCAGPDTNAVCTAYQLAVLFDLGLSPLLAARFCLRTDDQQIVDRLASLGGSQWTPTRAMVAELKSAARLHLVAETALGRAETFAPLADNFDKRTNAEIRELPEGWELKPVFAPCALFFPASRRPACAFVDGPF